jgi:hypothetical protein
VAFNRGVFIGSLSLRSYISKRSFFAANLVSLRIKRQHILRQYRDNNLTIPSIH